VRAFWKQQLNYGRAEADLERKWPEKYNAVGHARWSGRLYSKSMMQRLGFFTAPRIYHGTWGSALFQTATVDPPGFWRSLPSMPEWWMLVVCLAAASSLATVWKPMLLAIPLLIAAAGVPLMQC